MALATCHWAIIPTRSDEASIDGLQRVAERFERVRALWNADLRLLGVVLFAVGTSSRRIQARTRQLLIELLDDHSVFSTTIRSVEAAATDCRRRGELVHELEAAVQEAKPWWQVRREGGAGDQLASSASSLASDYERLAEEVVKRITHLSTSDPLNAGPAFARNQ
jgi:cellulose biosynthesis protein BcsQ